MAQADEMGEGEGRDDGFVEGFDSINRRRNKKRPGAGLYYKCISPLPLLLLIIFKELFTVCVYTLIDSVEVSGYVYLFHCTATRTCSRV